VNIDYPLVDYLFPTASPPQDGQGMMRGSQPERKARIGALGPRFLLA